jgi:hypothetical protein
VAASVPRADRCRWDLILRDTGLPSRSALVAPPLRLAALRWHGASVVLGRLRPPQEGASSGFSVSRVREPGTAERDSVCVRPDSDRRMPGTRPSWPWRQTVAGTPAGAPLHARRLMGAHRRSDSCRRSAASGSCRGDSPPLPPDRLAATTAPSLPHPREFSPHPPFTDSRPPPLPPSPTPASFPRTHPSQTRGHHRSLPPPPPRVRRAFCSSRATRCGLRRPGLDAEPNSALHSDAREMF